MKCVLVTGNSGFIGKRLFDTLSELNYKVRGFDKDYLSDPGWKTTLTDMLDSENPDSVFHVGACADTLEVNVQNMMILNYESTKVITDWCVTKEKKIIYSSSAANSGESGLYPSNLYGWSKYVAEDYVINRGGVALRYFNVYGPGEQAKGRMASFLFQAFTKSKAEQEIKLFPGKPLRDFVYIEDIISANIYAEMKYDELQGSYYEVSTGVAHSFEEKLDIFGLPYSYSDKDDIPIGYQFFTCGKPERWMPGWSPKFSHELGVLDYKDKLEGRQ